MKPGDLIKLKPNGNGYMFLASALDDKTATHDLVEIPSETMLYIEPKDISDNPMLDRGNGEEEMIAIKVLCDEKIYWAVTGKEDIEVAKKATDNNG